MNNNEKELRKSIGRKIKLARMKANFTQEQLAEKLSLSTRYISQLERGISFGSASTITGLCKALGTNSDFLFHDVIQSKIPLSDYTINEKLIENYLMLNEHNKSLLISLSNELLRFQNSNDNINILYK